MTNVNIELAFMNEEDEDERIKDAKLAAELGRVLLQDNKNLHTQIEDLKRQKEAEVEELKQRIQWLETQVNSLKGNSNGDQLEAEQKKWKTQLELAEQVRYEMADEMEKMKAEIKTLRLQFKHDRETIKILKEMVEVQKEALNDASEVEAENKRLIRKLKNQPAKVSHETGENNDTLHGTDTQDDDRYEERHSLVSSPSKVKFEEKIKDLEEENRELRQLLQDRDQLAAKVQVLAEQNNSYKKQQKEMQQLLDEARKRAAELKESKELTPPVPVLSQELLNLNLQDLGIKPVPKEEPKTTLKEEYKESEKWESHRVAPSRSVSSLAEKRFKLEVLEQRLRNSVILSSDTSDDSDEFPGIMRSVFTSTEEVGEYGSIMYDWF